MFARKGSPLPNVGDSRLYLFNGESLKLITRDHSFVEELVRSGVITREPGGDAPAAKYPYACSRNKSVYKGRYGDC